MSWVLFAALDHAPVLADGGFTVPYSVLVSREHRVVDVYRTVEGVVRREYERAPRHMLQALGAAREPTARRDTVTAHAPSKCTAELVMRTVDDKGGAPYLTPHFLDKQQARNVLLHGDPYARKTTLGSSGQLVTDAVSPDDAATAPPPVRAKDSDIADARGLLQHHVPTGADRTGHETLRVSWLARCPHRECMQRDGRARHPKLAVPPCCRVAARSNSTGAAASLHESFATFEGPTFLSRPTEIDDALQQRVTKATDYVIRKLGQHNGRDVTECVLLFRVAPQDALVLLYAQHVAFAVWGDTPTTSAVAPFRVPFQFRAVGGRLVHRHAAADGAVNEEDLVKMPSVDEIFGRGKRVERARRIAAETAESQRRQRAEIKRHRQDAAELAMGEATSEWADSMQALGLRRDGGIAVSSVEATREPNSRAAPARTSTSAQSQRTRSATHKSRPGTAQMPDVRVNEAKLMQEQVEGTLRRRQAEALSTAASLLAVLDGKRPLDRKLARHFHLTREQRAFLKKSETPEDYLPRAERKRAASATPSRQAPRTAAFDGRGTSFPQMFDASLHRAGSERPPTPKPTMLRRRRTAASGKDATGPPRPPKPSHGTTGPATAKQNAPSSPAPAPGGRRNSLGEEAGSRAGESQTVSRAPSRAASRMTSPMSSDFAELAEFTTLSIEHLSLSENDSEYAGNDDDEGVAEPHATTDRTLERLAQLDAGLPVEVKGDLRRVMEALLALPVPEVIGSAPTVKDKHDMLRRGVEAVTEYLVDMTYQLESFFMAERHRRDDITVTTCSGPLADRAATLLLSFPAQVVSPAMERRFAAFVRSLPAWFEIIDAAECRALVADPKVRTHALADADTYATHERVIYGGGVAPALIFGIVQQPPAAELRMKARTWLLRTLRVTYLERTDEMADEAAALLASQPVSPAVTASNAGIQVESATMIERSRVV